MNRLTALLCLTMCFCWSFAQNRANYFAVGYTPGFLLAHRADIKHLAAHNFGLELAYERDASSTSWGQHYRKPIIGYSFLYYNIGNEITGSGYGAFMHAKFNVFNVAKTSGYFRMGAGLGYLTEYFDPYENRRNQAIGSGLNGSMQFSLLLNRPIEKWNSYIEYGIGISHYSNAAYKMPNLGYNMPALFLRYGLEGNGEQFKSESSEMALQQWRIAATAIYGKKQRNFANPVDFYHKGVQVKALRAVSAVSAIRGGLDATLDKTYKYTENPIFPLDSVSFGDQLELGLAAGYEWNFGKVGAYGELGAYVYKPSTLKDPFYQRMGVIYNMSERFKLQGALKFHRGVADYFEMGLTYLVKK